MTTTTTNQVTSKVAKLETRRLALIAEMSDEFAGTLPAAISKLVYRPIRPDSSLSYQQRMAGLFTHVEAQWTIAFRQERAARAQELNQRRLAIIAQIDCNRAHPALDGFKPLELSQLFNQITVRTRDLDLLEADLARASRAISAYFGEIGPVRRQIGSTPEPSQRPASPIRVRQGSNGWRAGRSLTEAAIEASLATIEAGAQAVRTAPPVPNRAAKVDTTKSKSKKGGTK